MKVHQIPKAREECEGQGRKDWVAAAMRLYSGTVCGSSDSSPGLHATGHFKKTGHPVIRGHCQTKPGNGATYMKSTGNNRLREKKS